MADEINTLEDLNTVAGLEASPAAVSLAELREQIRDAVRCHFDEGAGPTVIRLHFVREEVIAP